MVTQLEVSFVSIQFQENFCRVRPAVQVWSAHSLWPKYRLRLWSRRHWGEQGRALLWTGRHSHNQHVQRYGTILSSLDQLKQRNKKEVAVNLRKIKRSCLAVVDWKWIPQHLVCFFELFLAYLSFYRLHRQLQSVWPCKQVQQVWGGLQAGGAGRWLWQWAVRR